MKVLWTPQALQDREAIWTHIAADSPAAASRMDQLFSDAVSRLAEYPQLGRPGMMGGTRELTPHRTYRLVYDINRDIIRVLALVHTARQWPPAQA